MLRNTMRSPFIAFVAMFSFLVVSCGRDMISGKQMNEQEAFDTLANFDSLEDSRNAFGGKKLNTAELVALLEDLVATGQIELSANQRSAVTLPSGIVDLSLLKTILELVKSGKVKTVIGLARELIKIVGAGGKLGLSGILEIITKALPIIVNIAPGFAPVLGALKLILPLVLKIFGRNAADATVFMPVQTA